jgi:hypothetical protein
MISAFIPWLPDMDILFNENDECRLVIPWAHKQELLRREEESRLRPRQGEYANRYDEQTWPSLSPRSETSSNAI